MGRTGFSSKFADATGGVAVFGDGSDGDVTIAADTPLTKDMFYNDLTVNITKILSPAGFRIFVKGTLTNNGTISRNGNNAVGHVPGAVLAAGSLGGSGIGADPADNSLGAGGSGGGVVCIVAKVIINNGTISANGGNGGDATIAGSNVSAVAGDAAPSSLGGSGGAGGTTDYEAGGAGGVATVPVAGGYRALPVAILLKDETTEFVGGGPGGAGSRSITKAGGGGGGGGGVLVFIYNTATWGTEQVAGGTGGAGVGAGADGVAGSTGTVIKITNN